MKKFLFLFAVAVLATTDLAAKELRTVVFKVMQMECPNCEKKVKKMLTTESCLFIKNSFKNFSTKLKFHVQTVR